jgi:hypothetical protein
LEERNEDEERKDRWIAIKRVLGIRWKTGPSLFRVQREQLVDNNYNTLPCIVRIVHELDIYLFH